MEEFSAALAAAAAVAGEPLHHSPWPSSWHLHDSWGGGLAFLWPGGKESQERRRKMMKSNMALK